ncbi:hypothetical protein DFP72DRAFT_323199 [Ephemerocybe angulata]|uniref:Uncharacterized protein n=1 Tax=Ephemerocybe angulata TaxID=980116 RepID=A0A8H6MD18_9AGAR|nr:hypothetical protein DFP72DRAFT_323199 [Tulosesus angulatus]
MRHASTSVCRPFPWPWLFFLGCFASMRRKRGYLGNLEAWRGLDVCRFIHSASLPRYGSPRSSLLCFSSFRLSFSWRWAWMPAQYVFIQCVETDIITFCGCTIDGGASSTPWISCIYHSCTCVIPFYSLCWIILGIFVTHHPPPPSLLFSFLFLLDSRRAAVHLV